MKAAEYRGYYIVSDGFGMKTLKTVGRGSVAKALQGGYTTEGIAKKAIDLYLDSKKVVEGDKTD